MARLFRLLEHRGHQVIRVPELLNPLIAEPAKCTGSRSAPIRWQDRFPHREHHNRASRMPRKNLADCGGPPQTCWSRGGEKQDYAGATGHLIEVGLHAIERRFIHFH